MTAAGDDRRSRIPDHEARGVDDGAPDMSTANFDRRDRWDNRTICSEYDPVRVRLMARSGGYVMVRKPRCAPFVLTEKEWAKLPLFESPQP